MPDGILQYSWFISEPSENIGTLVFITEKAM
jgi:hypothetical protein